MSRGNTIKMLIPLRELSQFVTVLYWQELMQPSPHLCSVLATAPKSVYACASANEKIPDVSFLRQVGYANFIKETFLKVTSGKIYGLY